MKHFLLFCMMAAVLPANAQNKRTMVVNKLRAVEQKDVNTPVTSNNSVKEVNTDKAIENDEGVSVQLVSCEPGVTKNKAVKAEVEVKDGYPLLPGVLTTSSWSDNWFMNLQLGGSTFIGSPIGCGDMFDRASFNFNGSFGKWVTPAVGMRIAYQGFKFKDCTMASQNYNAAHMDILYNVTSHFHSYDNGLSGEPTLPKWDVIPYIGVGIMWSSIHPGGLSEYYDTPKINHPFSIAYGVQMRYRVAQRLHLTSEIGGVSTFQSFDGWGKASRFGDNIFSASAGISVTLGKTGWRKAIDASALTYENDILKERLMRYEKNSFGNEDNEYGNDNIRESSYSSSESYSLPVSETYSGLESLRNRLKNHGKAFNGKDIPEGSNIPAIGVPVFFFFQLNTDVLVDESQLVNLDEIAKLAKQKTLIVRITGAADSATGSEEQNRELAKMRTKYIAKALLDRGVPLEQLRGFSYGGTDMYKRNEENRFTRCVLVERE